MQGSVRLERTDGTNQLQPRPHRSLSVVLMGLRIAEIHQHAVSHVLGHEAAEATHRLGDAFLIGGNDLAQVLRVHAGGECGRTDKVGEHHRDLAALAGVLGLRFRSDGRFRSCRGGAGKLTNSREYFPPMPERNADVLEVLIAQMAEYGNINLILGKALSVLPETELFEPVRNLLHRRSLREFIVA